AESTSEGPTREGSAPIGLSSERAAKRAGASVPDSRSASTGIPTSLASESSSPASPSDATQESRLVGASSGALSPSAEETTQALPWRSYRFPSPAQRRPSGKEAPGEGGDQAS